ncbi:MAG: hypothetical protein ISS01_00520 [Nanoarchaeota archaeon]|nr:hypothetical protein [Nanoarchaeota archaeon]
MELKTIELTAKKVEQLNEQPALESNMSISRDGKWFIHKTTITTIKPVKYVDKVMGYVFNESS